MGRDRRGATPANGVANGAAAKRLWADEPEPEEAELVCALCQAALGADEERMEGAPGGCRAGAGCAAPVLRCV